MVHPPQTSASISGITGEATGSYFESGTGKEGDPYIIASAKQLYYFNWLQDLGYFNEADETTKKIHTTYFKIKDGVKEMDAGDYILPPAGTSEFPFVGNFDGNGCVVKNLTISNSWEELESKKPAQAKQNGAILESSEIVGFFGVVGEYATDISYEASANAVKDLYFDNLTVKSAAANVLAGFIAGYANGAIDNCGVHCGQFSFVNGATALTGTKLEGKSLSRFTLIGDYDETSKNFVWTGQPSSGGDEGNDWGGSIDFYSLNRRLTYITGRQSSATASGSYSLVEDSGFNSSWKIDIRGFVNNSEKDNPFCYIKAGTILPLNVNTDAEDSNSVFYGGEIDGNLTTTYSSSSYQWKSTSFYKNKTSEEDAILSSNTGYLIGGNHIAGSSGDVAANVQLLASGLSGINSPYDGTAAMYTIDTRTSGNTASVEVDSTNYQSTFGYTRYKAVREEFDKTMNGLTKVHGFHMYQISDYLTNYKTYITTAKAKINNVTYPAYQFMDSGVNFTLKKSGYITVIAGAYYRKGYSHTLFDLYKVDRDASGTITGLNRINQIAGTKGSGNYTYYYGSDSTSSNLLFDFSKISATACLNSKKAYYFEIPVNAGDYVIANQSNANSAYLMYLDIGANASSSSDSSTTIENTNIDFVYKENGALAKITDEGYTPSGVVFSIGGPSTSAGLIYFKRETKNNKDEGEVVYVGVAYYAETGCSITPAGNGKSTKKEPDAD